MSETLHELRSLPDEELIKRHDSLASHTCVGTNHYLGELARRDQDRQTQAMLRYTCWITVMTCLMLACTMVNVFVAISLACR